MNDSNQYNDLLYQQIQKALHGEALIESALPGLYQMTTPAPLKAAIKQLMDANKVHQDLLDTATLSLSSYSDGNEHKHYALESLHSQLKEITEHEKPSHNLVIPMLQKIIHQQMADFEILSSLTKQTGFNHLAEDFRGLLDESNVMLDELQKEWTVLSQ